MKYTLTGGKKLFQIFVLENRENAEFVTGENHNCYAIRNSTDK